MSIEVICTHVRDLKAIPCTLTAHVNMVYANSAVNKEYLILPHEMVLRAEQGESIWEQVSQCLNRINLRGISSGNY